MENEAVGEGGWVLRVSFSEMTVLCWNCPLNQAKLPSFIPHETTVLRPYPQGDAMPLQQPYDGGIIGICGISLAPGHVCGGKIVSFSPALFSASIHRSFPCFRHRALCISPASQQLSGRRNVCYQMYLTKRAMAANPQARSYLILLVDF